MKTIWKETLKFQAITDVEMNMDSRVIHVDVQNSLINIWFEIDLEKDLFIRYFKVYRTGNIHDNPEKEKHVGTCLDSDWSVWHVYEI
jgi:hypothetical protein